MDWLIITEENGPITSFIDTNKNLLKSKPTKSKMKGSGKTGKNVKIAKSIVPEEIAEENENKVGQRFPLSEVQNWMEVLSGGQYFKTLTWLILMV